MTDAPEMIWVNPITTDRGPFLEGEWYNEAGSRFIASTPYRPADMPRPEDVARIADLEAALARTQDALDDAASGLDYVRFHYGELAGVGFDRVRDKVDALKGGEG